MDINDTSVAETTNPASANDDFLSAFTGNAVPTAAEPEGTEADQQNVTDKPETTPKDNGKDYVIRHKGQDKTLHLDDNQHTALLQKGYDYDEVRKQRDELQASSKNLERLERAANYVAANNGMPVEDWLAYVDSQTSEDGILAEIESAYPDAPADMKKELLESRKAKLAAQKEAEAEKEAEAAMAAVKAEYPEEDLMNPPSDVQADIADGMKPVDAYRLHELRELRKKYAELDSKYAALQKEKDNHFRSVGPAESKANDIAADPFLTGFMGGG